MIEFDVPQRLRSMVVRYDREDLIIKLAGLMLTPKYQDNYLRISLLTQLAIATSTGKKIATLIDIAKMLNLLLDHVVGKNEDPSEDVFISAVTMHDIGDLRIFNGSFLGSDFHLQRILDALDNIESPTVVSFLSSCRALLRISDRIARRCNLDANTFAAGEIWRRTWPRSLPPLIQNGKITICNTGVLEALEIDRSALEPFILTQPKKLLELPMYENEIMARPLIEVKDGLMLPIPSLVSPAIRLFLARAVKQGEILGQEIAELLNTQLFARWILHDFPIRGHHPLKVEEIPVSNPKFEGLGDYDHALVRFDEDKVAHIIVLSANWERIPNFALHEISEPPRFFSAHLNSYIENAADELMSHFGSDRGLTLIVYDSPGWNVNFNLSAKSSKHWFVQGTTASSISMLLADTEFNLLDLWKLLLHKQEFEESKVLFRLWPELTNYWTIWQELGGSFVPPGINIDNFGQIIGDTGAIQPWAAKVRKYRNAHGVKDITGQWVLVERYIDLEEPVDETSRSIFYQPFAHLSGRLRNVIEVGGSSWWIEMARPPLSVEDYQYIYLLWQTTTEWAFRLAKAQSNPLNFGEARSFQIRLLPVPNDILDAPQDFEFEYIEDYSTVTVIVPTNFIERLITPDNEGEVLLVRAIANAACMAFGNIRSEEAITSWIEEVTKEPSLKMMHVTYSADIGLSIDQVADRLSYRYLQTSDLLRAARSARRILDPELAGQINSPNRSSVIACLNSIVDARWRRCRTQLQKINRTALLTLVMRQIEGIHRDRVNDERAALARTSFYSPGYDLGNWMVEKISKRDAAFRTYRVLAEMAVSESPLNGGRAPGLSDIDSIAAEIFLLTLTAEYSDAIKYELMPGRIAFKSDGALELDSEGATISIPEYLHASLAEVSNVDIESYQDLYSDPISEDPVKLADDPYCAVFKAEFGISLISAAEIQAALHEVALHEKNHVICITRSQLLEKLYELGKNIEVSQLDIFILIFGLRHRVAWDTAPSGFLGSDIWPWLFERKLSLMMRPVLIVNDDPDPLLIYGVRQLEMALHYVSHLLENGIWPKSKLDSAEARSWVDQAVAKRGFDFESEITDIVEAMGWTTFTSLHMKRLGAPKKLGEIDIFAVSPDRKTWLVLECKWFGAVRTAREIANWLQDYHGISGDKLERHLLRYEWINENKNTVAIRLKLKAPKRILGRITTTLPVPLTYQEKLPENAHVVTRRKMIETLTELAEYN